MDYGQLQVSPERIAIVKSYRKLDDLIPSYWQEGFVEANGLQHHYYRTGGEKPQLVLLHGFEESAICWLRVAKALEHDYDIVMIDARGHGLSDRIGAHGFTRDLLTEDAAAVFEALRLGQPQVLGFSMGSDTVIKLAALHPQLVRAIIAAGISDNAPDGQAIANSASYQAWYQTFVAWLKQLKTQSHQGRMMAMLNQFPPGSPLPPEDVYVPMVEASANLDIDLALMGNELWSRASSQYAETQRLRQFIACRALFIYSGRFPTPGAQVTVREEPSQRPNEKILRFENAGHLIYRDNFEQFIDVVKAFLKQQ